MLKDIVIAWVPLFFILSVWFFAAWYFGRRVEHEKQKWVPDKSSPIDCVSLVRGIEGANYLRKYKIFVDGDRVGVIGSGETIHIPVDPGTHRIWIKVDFLRSRELAFEKDANRNVRLFCGSRYQNWKCLIMWLFKPMDYVYVQDEV